MNYSCSCLGPLPQLVHLKLSQKGNLLLSGFMQNVLIDAQNSRRLTYCTVKVLRVCKLWKKVYYPSYYFPRQLGPCRILKWLGSFTQSLFSPKIWNSIGPLFWVRKIYKLFNQLERAFWQDFPHILRNHAGTKNCVCGTKDMLLQLQDN